MAPESGPDPELISGSYFSTLDIILLIGIGAATLWWLWKNYLKTEEVSAAKSYTIV